MASQTAPKTFLDYQPNARRSGKSPSRSPAPNGRKQQKQKQPPQVKGYASEGVQDHDILNLPGSDWQLLLALTLVACFVRLFRIAQPTSVVFDEVQYVAINQDNLRTPVDISF